MSWGGSEKNHWFQLDVSISMLWDWSPSVHVHGVKIVQFLRNRNQMKTHTTLKKAVLKQFLECIVPEIIPYYHRLLLHVVWLRAAVFTVMNQPQATVALQDPIPTGPPHWSPNSRKGNQDPERAIKGSSKRNKLQWEREGNQDLTVQFWSTSGVGLKQDLFALVD